MFSFRYRRLHSRRSFTYCVVIVGPLLSLSVVFEPRYVVNKSVAGVGIKRLCLEDWPGWALRGCLGIIHQKSKQKSTGLPQSVRAFVTVTESVDENDASKLDILETDEDNRSVRRGFWMPVFCSRSLSLRV